MPIQEHNDQRGILMGGDVFRNGVQYLHEPIGDFGVWNGQFETGPGSGSPDGWPEGWELYEYTDGSIARDTNGLAGNWRLKGGQVGTGRGGYAVSLRYIPVDEDRDYYLSGAFMGSSAAASIYFGVYCYNSNKVYLGTVYLLSAYTPGVNWDRRQMRIGPNGDQTFWAAGGTRYIRVVIVLQYDVTQINTWAYADDIQFQQMKATYSPEIRLMDDVVTYNTVVTFSKAAYTLYPNSTLNLTLEEPGYIWFSYYWSARSDTVRTSSWAARPYIDAGVMAAIIVQGYGTANTYSNHCVTGRSAALALGAHSVDLRIYCYNIADTITCAYLHGTIWYTREN